MKIIFVVELNNTATIRDLDKLLTALKAQSWIRSLRVRFPKLMQPKEKTS